MAFLQSIFDRGALSRYQKKVAAINALEDKVF
jgi:hypothetical protein